MPVCACTCRAMRSMISSVTSWIEAAMSISRCVSGDSGCRGGPPNSRSNFVRGHRQPLAVVEVRHVHAERAVLLQVDQLVAGSARRTSARRRGQAHQLVLAGVDPEAAEVGEGRIEQPQRCGKRISCVSVMRLPRPYAEAGRGPFADAVEREDGRLLEGRREERAGGVRFVMLGEDVPLAIVVARARG